MTAEVRRHIRTQRDRRVRSSLTRRHVVFCGECGSPYDRSGPTVRPECRECKRERHAAL